MSRLDFKGCQMIQHVLLHQELMPEFPVLHNVSRSSLQFIPPTKIVMGRLVLRQLDLHLCELP